ncbi:hypothetical protein AMTRI_Chr13g121260 [Amborella trichopoda]
MLSVDLGLAYVIDTTWPRDVNHYHRILDELSSFDWVIRGLEIVSLLLPPWVIHALFWQGSTSQRGISLRWCFASFTILRNILLQERRSIVALSVHFDDTLPLFWSRLICCGRKRSPLLVRGYLSKTSPQPLRTMILCGTCLPSSTMPQIFETSWRTLCSCPGTHVFSGRRCLFFK